MRSEAYAASRTSICIHSILLRKPVSPSVGLCKLIHSCMYSMHMLESHIVSEQQYCCCVRNDCDRSMRANVRWRIVHTHTLRNSNAKENMKWNEMIFWEKNGARVNERMSFSHWHSFNQNDDDHTDVCVCYTANWLNVWSYKNLSNIRFAHSISRSLTLSWPLFSLRF